MRLKLGEIKNGIIKEVKDALTKEFTTNVTSKVKNEFDNKIDKKAKEFKSCTKEIFDVINMDLNV